MIILPGGQPGTNNLNADQRIHRLLAEFQSSGKLIGAICAAPIVLAAAGLLAGKRATCHPGSSDKLAGAAYDSQSAVVIDGNIITSQAAGTAILFALAIVSRLAGAQTADEISKAMLVQ
jgi:4-methyl-5(b-hydroxyethyl)-thiazole monophosphate biosynthesis